MQEFTLSELLIKDQNAQLIRRSALIQRQGENILKD